MSQAFGNPRPFLMWFFHEHFNRLFIYEVFYIQAREMCLNKRFLHHDFLVFGSFVDSFSPKKCYMP